jgi:hypothetical protein
MSTDTLFANRNNQRPEDVLVPDSCERRGSHVLHGLYWGSVNNSQPVASEDVGPYRKSSAQATGSSAFSFTASKTAGISDQPCDYCLRNNKLCRLKLSGTCFNCAGRKKKCRYSSGKSLPTARGSIARSVSMAAEQTHSGAVQPSAYGHGENEAILSATAQDSPRANLDNSVQHADGHQERLALIPQSRTLQAPEYLSDGAASHVSAAASTADDDLELPPTITIRSSSLVRRGIEDIVASPSAQRAPVV